MFKKILFQLIAGATEEGITAVLDIYKQKIGDQKFQELQASLETTLSDLDQIAKDQGLKLIDQVLQILEKGVENA